MTSTGRIETIGGPRYSEGPLADAADYIRAEADAFRRDSDPGHIHQVRVTTRRLRAVLDSLPANGETEQLRARLKSLANALGPTRDADVVNAVVAGTVGELSKGKQTALTPITSVLQFEASRLRADAAVHLRSVPFYRLLKRVRTFHPDDSGDSVPAPERADGLAYLRKLRRSYRRWKQAGTPESLHRMRISVKKLRYALAARERDGAKSGIGGTRRRLAKLQDLLGEINDLHVAAERGSGMRAEDGSSWAEKTLKSSHGLEARLDRQAQSLTGRVKKSYRRANGKKRRRAARKVLAEVR